MEAENKKVIETKIVKYFWSHALWLYEKYDDDTENWEQLNSTSWAELGFPEAEIVSILPETEIYKKGKNPDIYAKDITGIEHKLTFKEWHDMGKPEPKIFS
ncbi:MAG: hypothetical protein QM613_04615 [Micrococcaceae bacterium]